MVNTRKGGLLEPAVTIRPFVVGRKNYLFSQSIRGVRANANPYSLIETAKEHGVGPLAYLIEVFERLPAAATISCIATAVERRFNFSVRKSWKRKCSLGTFYQGRFIIRNTV